MTPQKIDRDQDLFCIWNRQRPLKKIVLVICTSEFLLSSDFLSLLVNIAIDGRDVGLDVFVGK